ncbi:MAG: single-stranded DNA-binding protein [Bifidobacteriaceae bacterium]|jgi:single-strand DNA-binding protein|nr:single-stranded DNA-binding protein [Bifidobacteriaceae bacterium]
MGNDITVKGFVGTEPQFYTGKDENSDRCTFRVACNKRFLDRKTGGWREGETVWFTVKTWRSLANNVSKSIKKSDPVLVIGELTVDTWGDSEKRQEISITAHTVGHDLGRGTADFTRSRSRDTSLQTSNPELQDMASVAEFQEVGA